MEITDSTSDAAVAAELGARVRQVRLNRVVTQSALADRAGVSELTVRKLESGELVQLRVMLRVLRALGLLHNVNALVPDEPSSPIAESNRVGHARRRARRPAVPTREWSWSDPE